MAKPVSIGDAVAISGGFLGSTVECVPVVKVKDSDTPFIRVTQYANWLGCFLYPYKKRKENNYTQRAPAFFAMLQDALERAAESESSSSPQKAADDDWLAGLDIEQPKKKPKKTRTHRKNATLSIDVPVRFGAAELKTIRARDETHARSKKKSFLLEKADLEWALDFMLDEHKDDGSDDEPELGFTWSQGLARWSLTATTEDGQVMTFQKYVKRSKVVNGETFALDMDELASRKLKVQARLAMEAKEKGCTNDFLDEDTP